MRPRTAASASSVRGSEIAAARSPPSPSGTPSIWRAFRWSSASDPRFRLLARLDRISPPWRICGPAAASRGLSGLSSAARGARKANWATAQRVGSMVSSELGDREDVRRKRDEDAYVLTLLVS